MTCDSRRQPCRLKAHSRSMARRFQLALYSPYHICTCLSAQQACYLQLAPRHTQLVMRSCLHQHVSGPPGLQRAVKGRCVSVPGHITSR